MAPEVLCGEAASYRSDVYSLGAVLYSLCAKGPPFSGLHFAELVKVVSEVDAPPLRKVAVAVDVTFAAIVDRCLHRDPEQRYPSAEELREVLELLQEGGVGLRLPDGNPYRGLLPFEAEHRALFFGRQGEIGTIVERLRTEPSVLLVADSGIGKSSLVRAGVLPLLCEGVLDRNRSWRQATMVPGRHPQAALLESLAALIGCPPAVLDDEVRSEPRRLGRVLSRRIGDKVGLVLFIDQLEELVTLSTSEEAQWVGEALASLHGGVTSFRLLMTARADYLSRLGALPGLGEEITRAFYLLRPLSGERLREVIVGPARRKGLRFESEELVTQLMESTAQTDSGLPLLQFALAELWEARSGEVLSVKSLHEIGGVEGALARHADLVLGRLPIEQRVTARRILMALVTLEGTRARRSEADLLRAGSAASAVLGMLVRGRLLVVRHTPEGTVYEVAHEALIKGWSTLSRWLEANKESRAARHRLEASSAEWLRLNRSSDVLWGVKQLAEAELLEEGDIGEKEAIFLERSRQALHARQQLRRVLIFLLPCLLGLLYVGSRVKSARDLRQRVEMLVAAGEAVHAQAQKREAELTLLRAQSFADFDAQKPRSGELKWTRIQERSAELDSLYVEATQSIEAAAVLDGSRQDVRERVAVLLYERAVAAERDQQLLRMRDIVARLPLYDGDGKQLGRWRAPATIEIVTDPPGATISVAEYREDKSGRFELSAERALGTSPLAPVALPAGSLLFKLQARGRVEVRYPVLTHRGEKLPLRIAMREEKQVPQGYVYIPPGRFLFGQPGDDRLRRMFYYAVPLHEMQTAGYLIGRYEVSYREWIEYLEALEPAEREKLLHVEHSGNYAQLSKQPDGTWQLTFLAGSETYSWRSNETLLYPRRKVRVAQNWLRLPVGAINRDEAEDYAAWLSRSGRVHGARLCTEQE